MALDVKEPKVIEGTSLLGEELLQRKRAEEALRESEERYRAIFEQAADSIVLIDSETGALVAFNERAHESLGYTRQEFRNLKIPDFEVIESAEEVAKHIEKVVKEGSDAFETKQRTKDGEIRDILVSARAISIGGRDFVQGIWRDMTERKRAEAEIREKTEDLTLINSLNNAINQGDPLQAVIQLLSRETKKIFSSFGATIYLLSEDKEHLVMQNLTLPPKMVKRIEKLIGIKIAEIRIPLKAGSLYRQALQASKPQLINDPATIQSLVPEFTENKALKKLVPNIYSILGIRSVINVPLVSEGEAIGLLDISRKEPFTESDVRRCETISRQLTVAIKRKQAEEATELAYAELDQIFDTAAGGMRVIDIDFNVLRINETFSTLARVSKDEALGKKCYEVFAGPACHTSNCPLTQILGGEERVEYEVAKECNDDIRIPCIVTATPFRGPGGELIGIVEDFKDITERKWAEETLRESEENYRGLVERANDGIVIVQDKLLKYVNPRLEEISGYSIDELIDTPFTDYISPDELPKLLDRYQRRMAGKNVTPIYETVLRRKDGSKVYAELNAGVITYQGKPADLVIVRDITERKKAEEEIRHRIDELATLNEIGRAIASTMKLDELWELIYQQTCRVMEVSAFYIALYDREKEELRSVIDMLQGEHRPQREKSRRFRKGRTEYIIRTRQPLLTRGDVQETYDRLGIVSSDKRAKAFAGVPLIAGDEVIGVLAVQNYERHDAYDEHTISLLSTIASEAAIAIENARLYERSQSDFANLSCLFEASSRIGSTLDLSDTLQFITQAAVKASDGHSATIILTRPEGKAEIRTSVHYTGELRKAIEPRAEGVTAKVVQTGEAFIIPNVPEAKEWVNPEMIKAGFGAAACLPLRTATATLGAMWVNWTQPRHFPKREVELLQTFANEAAIAIENARLYGELRTELAERKRAEEALRESEERYRRLIELSPDGIMIADAEGTIHLANPVMLWMLGAQSGENVIGKKIFALIAPEELDHCFACFRGVIADPSRHAREETWFVRLDGERFPVEVDAGHFAWDGKPAVQMIVRDITERKQVQEELQESQQRLETIFDSAQTGILVIDAETHKIFDLNATAIEMIGVPKEQVVGNVCHQFVCPAEKGRCPITDLGQPVDKSERVLIKSDGESTPILKTVTSAMLRGRQHLIESFIDITERKRAEEEIRRRSEELTVLNNIGMAVTGALDLQEVLPTIQKRTRELLGEKYGPIFALFNEADQTLDVTLTHVQEDVVRRVDKLIGMKFEELSIPLASLKPALREALLARKPHVANDVRDFFTRGRSRRLFKGAQIAMGVKGIVALPLWAKGRLIGTMLLFSQREKIPEGEIELLSGIANQAAIAIENVRLFETIARGKKEWEETFDSVTDGVYLIDENYTLLRVNRALAESLGTTLKELIGRKCYEVVHGFDEPWSECPLREVLETKQAIAREAENGRTGRVLQLSVYPRLDDKGNAVGSVHVARDITERRRREREVERRNRELAALNAIAEAVIYSLDLEDVLRRALDKVLEITGFEAGGFGMVDEAKEMIVPIVHKGVPRDFLATFAQPKAGDGVRWQSVKSGEPIFLENLPHDPRVRGREALIEGFRAAAYLPLKIKDKSIGLMALGTGQDHHFSPEERSLLMTITSQIAVAMDNAGAYERLKAQNLEAISALAAAVEAKDPYTGGHSENVTLFTVVIAESMGLSNDEIEDLQVAALLHDIGKIGIPDGVLNKPARLTSDEFLMIKTHPVIAAEIVGKIEALTHIVPIIRHHHERWDGTGYPDGLKGEKIPLLARILAVADGYDAMTSERPYRGALSEEEVLRELEKGAGSQWDPQVVEVLVNKIVQKKGARSR